MKKVLLTALVAGAMFSCSNEEVDNLTPNVSGGENTVVISLDQADLSKGITDQKGDPEYAVIGSARIFFINASGNSIYQRELSNAEIATIANTETTSDEKMIEIKGIPNTAVMLYFLANVKTTDGTTYPLVDGSTATDARIRIDKLQGDAKNVAMSGLSSPFVADPLITTKFTTSVTIKPIVARIEVGQTTCNNQGQTPVTSDITAYKLSGVYINYARPNVLLTGAPYTAETPIDIKSQPSWSAATGWDTYLSANPNFPFFAGGSPLPPTGWQGNALVDYCTPTSAGLSFYPDATNGSTITDPAVTPKRAWAYQVCPTPIDTPTALPHIILKLTEVTYVNNPLGATTQYVTVTKYKNDLGDPIKEFNPANVYRIKNLSFTHNEATNKPYEKNITVTATVTVAPWILNNMNPDWN